MSDVGLYQAIEDAAETAITGISGMLGGVKKAMAYEDLIRVGFQQPTAGICLAASQRDGDLGTGNRPIAAMTRWDIAIVARNARGQAVARAAIYPLLERVRDALHRYQPTTATLGQQRFLWQGDQFIEVEQEDVVCAVATYTFGVRFGQ